MYHQSWKSCHCQLHVLVSQKLPGRDQQPNILPEWVGAGKQEMLVPARERLEWNMGQLDWEGKVRNWNMGDQDQNMMGDMVQFYHLSAGMVDVVETEDDLYDRLEDFAQRLEDAASKYK